MFSHEPGDPCEICEAVAKWPPMPLNLEPGQPPTIISLDDLEELNFTDWGRRVGAEFARRMDEQIFDLFTNVHE